MRKNIPPQQLHIPVLLDDVVHVLSPKSGEKYLDLTAGYGGHARAILSRTQAPENMTLVDRDEHAIAELQDLSAAGARLLHTDFADATKALAEEASTFDMVLVDLGVSSPQLDIASRGFSFLHDGPLDMRMDNRTAKTAADIVNYASERELTDIIQKYGEESRGFTKRIVAAIIAGRPFATTKQLADAIVGVHVGSWQRAHPATRTFQALRIALNDELGQLEAFMRLVPSLLSPGGRVAVISFHSLEDRIVKRSFAEQDRAGYEAELSLITKKPIRGNINDVHNPRARSATLRAAVKK